MPLYALPSTLMTGLVALLLVSACSVAPSSPEVDFAQRQQRVIVNLIGDDSITDRQRELRLAAAYEELMEVWRPSPHYGRFSTSDGFHHSVGYIYGTLGSYFDSRNELSRAIPYWRDGAEEALEAGIIDQFLQFQGRVFLNLIHTGQLERAELALQQLERELLDLLFRPDRYALAGSSDPAERFYYLVLEDFTLQLALHRDGALDVNRWRAFHQRRVEILDEDPRIRFMHLRREPGRFWGAGTALGFVDAEGSGRNPNWRPLYHIGQALAREAAEAETVETVIAGLHTDFDHMAERVVERGGFRSRLDMEQRQTREAVRSHYWRHQTEAALRLEMGQVDEAARAVVRAVEAFESARDLFAEVPEHLAAIEGFENDAFELVLLRARIDEQRGKYDSALEGYARFVAWSERNREALPLDQRQHFFESVARDGYLGQLRAAAWQYRQRPSDAAMRMVLDASEQFRSRQLMELLETDVSGVASLAELRSQLGPGDAVLMFNDMDSHLLAAVVDQRRHALVLMEKSPNWDRRLFDIRNRLAEQQYFAVDELTDLLRPLLSGVQRPLDQADGLYVLTDGALSVLPASILPMPDGRLLQRDRPLRYLPSLAMLGASASVSASPRRDLFAVGDPVYDRDAVVEQRIGDELLMATRGNPSLGMFTPLPETRDEVEAIARRFADSEVLVGLEASESVIKRADLSAFRFLHFATHGVLDGEIPDLDEPALVLSYEDGEDGLLTASEITRLRFNADLAVLSACNTGSGEYFRGEGLMGLGRAFMVAGSRQVLVSLWPVESFATKSLMLHFYEGLDDGLDAASALAQAQQKLMETEASELPAELRGLQRADRDAADYDGYRNPFFWSPFVLIGTH